MILAVAEATQTDPAMAGTSALDAMAACTGGHAEVEIRPGWREPLCLCTATAADPAERKSAVQGAMLQPFYDVERALADEVGAQRHDGQRHPAVRAGAALLSRPSWRRPCRHHH
jgi:replicative DNA helicase